ncbi:hypothetical protein V2J09_014488 [Rumex salicifolius]
MTSLLSVRGRSLASIVPSPDRYFPPAPRRVQSMTGTSDEVVYAVSALLIFRRVLETRRKTRRKTSYSKAKRLESIQEERKRLESIQEERKTNSRIRSVACFPSNEIFQRQIQALNFLLKIE